MERYCEPAMQNQTMSMAASAVCNQTVAAFLIVRPPIGFLDAADHRPHSGPDGPFNRSALVLQPGTPTGLCAKEAPGVYSREWSNGKAVLDCGSSRTFKKSMRTGLKELLGNRDSCVCCS